MALRAKFKAKGENCLIKERRISKINWDDMWLPVRSWHDFDLLFRLLDEIHTRIIFNQEIMSCKWPSLRMSSSWHLINQMYALHSFYAPCKLVNIWTLPRIAPFPTRPFLCFKGNLSAAEKGNGNILRPMPRDLRLGKARSLITTFEWKSGNEWERWKKMCISDQWTLWLAA